MSFRLDQFYPALRKSSNEFSSSASQEPTGTTCIGHSPSQYVDGLRGPLIVDDPHSPYTAKCDAELVMTVSDWYHGNVNLRDLQPTY
ncbi:unnamed protein product [Penicillium pancosmium]